MEMITLVDGTELNGHIMRFVDESMIFVYLTGMSIAEGFNYFINAENIATLLAMDHGTETVYEGYTEISSINVEFGNCNITLRRPVNAA